jgi:hypothetical protein
VRLGTCASDPDGGWYVREGDHREGSGPDGKARRKIYWALEATTLVRATPLGSVFLPQPGRGPQPRQAGRGPGQGRGPPA